MLKGGESGPAIVPGDPDASLLIKAVRHAPGVSKMPRSGPKLSDAQIAALAEWIRMGAPWPAASKTTMAPGARRRAPRERPIDPALRGVLVVPADREAAACPP